MTGSFANTIDLSLWYIFILQVHKCINIYSLHRIITLITSSVLSLSHWSRLGHVAVVYVGVLGPGHAALLAVAAVPGVAAVVEPALALVSGPITAE